MSGGKPELRVPQARVVVEVAAEGVARRRLELSVAMPPAGLGPAGWREVRDVLEGERRFLPARVPEEDRWLLLNRDRLLWVAVVGGEVVGGEDAAHPAAGDGGEPIQPEGLFDQRHKAVVELAGGAGRLRAEVLYSAPAARSRLADHLNGPEIFLCLRQGGRICFAHKSAVVEMAEIAEPEE